MKQSVNNPCSLWPPWLKKTLQIWFCLLVQIQPTRDKEKRGVPEPKTVGHNTASGMYPIPVSQAVQEGADGNSGKKHRPDEEACWRDSSPTVSLERLRAIPACDSA